LQGIALLGMREGQSVTVRQRCGSLETIRLEHVEYQPQAASGWLAGALHVPMKIVASSVCRSIGDLQLGGAVGRWR
jgi:hypothetical protein